MRCSSFVGHLFAMEVARNVGNTYLRWQACAPHENEPGATAAGGRGRVMWAKGLLRPFAFAFALRQPPAARRRHCSVSGPFSFLYFRFIFCWTFCFCFLLFNLIFIRLRADFSLLSTLFLFVYFVYLNDKVAAQWLGGSTARRLSGAARRLAAGHVQRRCRCHHNSTFNLSFVYLHSPNKANKFAAILLGKHFY